MHMVALNDIDLIWIIVARSRRLSPRRLDSIVTIITIAIF